MSTLSADREFNRNFLISCGAHVAFFLVAYIGGTAIVKIFNLNEKVEIIHSSVRVDVVGMPKFTVKELKEMQAEPVAKPEPEPEGAKVEAKAEVEDVIKKDDLVIEEKGPAPKKTPSFMNIVSNYSSKKVAPTERKRGAKSSTNKDLDSLIIEGNRLSKGGALVGDYSDADNSELSSYVQSLPELVRAHFKLPSYLLNEPLRCRIAVYLSPSGSLIKTEMIESSGNSEYDARAKSAIENAAPFPKPSAAVAPRLGSSGIILRFPL